MPSLDRFQLASSISCNRCSPIVTFADGPLITRIKTMASDPLTDDAVKKKLMSVLAGWNREFKDNPKMATVASLWTQCGGGVKVSDEPVYANRNSASDKFIPQ